MIWLSALWAKVWKYVLALGALLLAVLAIFWKGRQDGKAVQQAKVDAANQRAEVAQQQQQITESRHDTDTSVQQLPEAPAQRIGDADPATAAGKLQGWTRD